MTKIFAVIERINHFITEGCEVEELEDIRDTLVQYVKDNEVKSEEALCANDRCPTLYDKIVAELTPEELAKLNVKMVLLNMDECWWMTSSGQLYPFAHKQMALQHELHYLGQELEMPT